MANNKEIKDILVEVDVLLRRVSVRDDDVFAMTDARRLLKTVYDMIETETKGKEDTVNGG